MIATLAFAGGARQAGAQDPRSAPWTPPATTLPKPFVEAAAFLLAHGMGDPRGGEYREATIRVPTRRGAVPAAVHGWVFPNARPARVVTPDGLAHSVEHVGAEVNPASDVPRPDGQEGPFAALLLIDGREPLARRALGTPSDGRHTAVRALADFLRAESEDAIDAFAYGDDARASVVATRAVVEGDAIQAEGRRLGGSSFFPEHFAIDLVRKVALDAPRRVGRHRAPLDFAALSARPVAERVATLIDRLDDATTHGIVFNGYGDPKNDPIVEALVKIGAPAVEPLIDCVETDRRLTRVYSVSHSDWETILSIASVRDAAYRALQGILKIRDLPSEDDPAALRALWSRDRLRTPAERWLAVLADDAAGLDAWREAALDLFGYPYGRTYPRPFAADSLLGTQRRELGRLLARRTAQALTLKPEGYALEAPLQFAIDLDLLGSDGALPTLRAATRRAMAPGVELSWPGDAFAQAIERRGALEGATAWNEYAEWAERESLGMTKLNGTEAFRPLIDRRNVPRVREAMRALFASRNSVWSIAPNASNLGNWWWWSENFILSPLLEDPAFREAVLAALADPTPIGTVAVESNGYASLAYGSGSSGWGDGSALSDPLRPRLDTPLPIRVGDQVAMSLSPLKGAPAYQPYWPERERNRALGKIAAFLRENAGRLGSLLPSPIAYRWH